MAKERFPEMDVFKGILIVLVVIGHLIPQFVAEADGTGLRVPFFAIYGFHMEAFAFIAGFCSPQLLEAPSAASDGLYLRRRAERLLLPYLAWGGLYFLARLMVPFLGEEGYDLSRAWQFVIGYNPDGALWFLWTLFASTAIAWGGLRLLSPVWLVTMAALVCIPSLWTQPWQALPVAVNVLPLFVFSFAAGLLVRRHFASLRPALGHLGIVAVAFAVWCLVQARHPLTVTDVPWYLTGVTSVLGTAAFLCLSVRLADGAGGLRSAFEFLSAYAMEIFILSEPVKVVCRIAFRRLGLPLPFSFVVMFVLMLSVPVVLSRYVVRGRWPRLLLLGWWREADK